MKKVLVTGARNAAMANLILGGYDVQRLRKESKQATKKDFTLEDREKMQKAEVKRQQRQAKRMAQLERNTNHE